MSQDKPDRYRRPSRRPLRIFALDPQRIDRGRAGQVTPRTTVYVPYEQLRPGPIGGRIHVVDYDGVHRRYYEPIHLDDPDVLIRDGLAPSETDPRSHQQTVYAIIAELWADFETALGRRTSLGSRPQLTVLPHAFYGDNAYYDPEGGALLFGYFKASETNPGANLPGQMVFTCLSHDIVVHETTHALIDRLRPQFMLDMNPDVAAFHEGFSDLIAIFQHFKMPEVLLDALADTRGEIGRSEQLLGLARQFGYSTGQSEALRTAAGQPDASLYESTLEPHARGAILVRSVFDAFLSLYHQRTLDLVRLASDGTGLLRDGALPPDLIKRLAREASELARDMFSALVRAIDYLPPLDVTFEDFLRALVTVDFALSPSDESARVAFIEGFRRHGIYPKSAGSLGDYAVAWTRTTMKTELPFQPSVLNDVLLDLDNIDYVGMSASSADEANQGMHAWKQWGIELKTFAEDNRQQLGFVDGHPITVEARHAALRNRANGRPTYDLVVRFLQEREDLKEGFGGDVPMSGTTVVAGTDRVVRYIISKPLEEADQAHKSTARGPAADQDFELAPPPDELMDQSGRRGDRSAGDGADPATPQRVEELRKRLVSLRMTDPGDSYRPTAAGSRMRLKMTALHATGVGGAPIVVAPAKVKPRKQPKRAPATATAAAAAAAATTELPISVRMYNVGFGDCLLVTFGARGAAERQQRILFDCGRHAGSQPATSPLPGFEEVIKQLIEDVTDDRGPYIDIIVVTHRHRDHIHGFSKVELWKDVQVGQVWMPWVEDPKNTHAKALVDSQELLARRTLSALKALKAASGDKPGDTTFDAAEGIAYNATTNAVAMDLLRNGLARQFEPRYLPRLGYFPESLSKAELGNLIPDGVTIHILGPSRDPEVIVSLDPPDGAAYEPLSHKTALDANDADAMPVGEAPMPFGEGWFVEPSEYRAIDAKERRRIEKLAIEGSVSPLELVYRLDRSVNGTSLVVVIEAGDVRLLFPGDAQWGTWKAIMENPDARELVTNATLYKVGHHGSHNATPVEFVEKLLGLNGGRTTSLVSVAPTNYKGGWQDIPLNSLVDALSEHGDVISSHKDTAKGEFFVERNFIAHVAAAISEGTPSPTPQGRKKR